MNKKKIIFIATFLIVFITIIIIITCYQSSDNVQETSNNQTNQIVLNTINKHSLENNVIQNTIEQSSQNIVEQPTNEVLEQKEEIPDTKEKTKSQNNSKATNTKSTNTKKQTTSTKEQNDSKKSLTIKSSGTYDIKNGGTAIYSESVEMPSEWLDY